MDSFSVCVTCRDQIIYSCHIFSESFISPHKHFITVSESESLSVVLVNLWSYFEIIQLWPSVLGAVNLVCSGYQGDWSTERSLNDRCALNPTCLSHLL